jgi:hypothetical protein
MSDEDQHSREDRCFYCATDEEMLSMFTDGSRVTIHMQHPESFCPLVTESDS